MSALSKGTVVRLKNGKSCKVKKELGHGGQGIVYLVEYENKDYALKWYTAESIIKNSAFYDNLTKNANSGAPAPNFIWPLVITERQNGSFGYVMMLRPSGYEEMTQFLLTHAQFKSRLNEINACLQISQAFQLLHIRGLSYQDMNDGNFFINPQTGDVLICDNDNVAPDGINMGIAGKSGFMAPEIVEGILWTHLNSPDHTKPHARPNRYSDYYSLAVCLFILIYLNRPFEGAKYLSCPCDSSIANTRKLFGFSSVFIMDPTDSSNRPVKGMHNNVLRRWPVYPKLLADAFCKTFSKEAIKDPTKRLIDKQWNNILLQIRSNVISCPHCGKEIFYDTQVPDKPCPYCNKTPEQVTCLKIGKFTIPLINKQVIYECQITDMRDFMKQAGEVIVKDGKLGLINKSGFSWTVILPDNSVRIIEPGSGMPVRPGLKIKFGNNGESGAFV